MKAVFLLLIAVPFLISGYPQEEARVKWNIRATYYEACSCNAPCPCPFGLPMTNSTCTLTGLIDIHEGSYGTMGLKGIKVIQSGVVGDWGEYYFSEDAGEKQRRAIEEILQKINIAGFTKITKSEKANIYFGTRNDWILYSTDNIRVELEMVKGRNRQPVVVQNLEGKVYEHYIPYLSMVNKRFFRDGRRNYSFEKKAGFSASWNLSDRDFQ